MWETNYSLNFFIFIRIRIIASSKFSTKLTSEIKFNLNRLIVHRLSTSLNIVLAITKLQSVFKLTFFIVDIFIVISDRIHLK